LKVAKNHCFCFCWQVLPSFLDHADLLQARLVCHEWRTAFSRSTKQLQLVQPMSAGTARTLARKAAAAFPCAATLLIMLYHDDKATVTLDMTADDDAPVCTFNTKPDRPEAATALLRHFTKVANVQELQLRLQELHIGSSSSISRMLPLVPQLRVLDLSGCPHESADLLVVAQHLQHLQQLLLHCPKFTTLAGCKRSSGDASWARMGGCTSYKPSHVAALAQLKQLRHLECPVPTGSSCVKLANRTYAHPWACDCEWLLFIAVHKRRCCNMCFQQPPNRSRDAC
jgi:hypothetical protein